MAFHKKKDTETQIAEIINYHQYLKKDDDPVLKIFKTPEGHYLNITRIEQTEEEKKISDMMEKFYKNYHDSLQGKNE